MSPATAAPEAPAAASSQAPAADPAPRRWDDLFAVAWRPLAIINAAGLALGLFAWSLVHADLLPDLFARAADAGVRDAQRQARFWLQVVVAVAMVPALAASLVVLRRLRARRPLPSLSVLGVVIAAIPLPAFGVPGFEFAHPFLAGMAVLLFALALARALRDHWPARWLPSGDLSARAAWLAVLGGWLFFVGWMGFLAHWRFITFHAELYDTAWETNAVHGIVTHGLPSISSGSGDFYFNGQRLPVTYFDTHTPFFYYLYAPFYALYKDTRTLLWLQAMVMGAGAFGIYLFARRWLRSRGLAVVAALAYLLHPAVQGHCLHDIHANPLAIPTTLLALGLMEAGRPRWALALAFLTAVTREETAIYAACIGVFWLFTARTRPRAVAGLAVIVGSGVILVLVTQVLMPAFGGKPRWSHFTMFFDNGAPIGAALRAIFLNPVGAFVQAVQPYKVEFAWLALVPWGLCAVRGWKGGWFLLTPLALQVPTDHRDFFAAGINYSAPFIPAAIIMSVFGMRGLILRRPVHVASLPRRRLTVAAFVIVCALFSDFLWGNIAAKSYKLEYGMWPYRRTVRYHYENQIAYTARLPRFGERERGLWDVIHHVPPKVPISTSWSINPQLSNRDISLHYPHMGEGHQPEARPNYIVLDKLPPEMDHATEAEIDALRADPAWRVYYENRWGVIFERL
ncbi:MAG TPA: DUF2079 domain-containing protein [Polyangia bacterium]|nr:DUF2079 domain-containing protein [Polyangia bacterium]